MRCPFCAHGDTRVLDSRPTEEGAAIRRRRECAACGARFTTYEKVEMPPLVVVKKDGRREAFDRGKILRGLVTACEKRPVPMEALEAEAAVVARSTRPAQPSRSPSTLRQVKRRLRWVFCPGLYSA